MKNACFLYKVIQYLLVLFIFSNLTGQQVVFQGLLTQSQFDVISINQTKPTGSIKAVATVLNGSSNYSIPIPMPPTTNGITPELSINYGSNGGYGQLGYGWGLSGISMISRIGKNWYFDQARTGVDFTNNDKFSLDGNYLVLTSGTYGGVNSTYATEAENWSSIKFYPNTPQSGFSYFECTTKEGLLIEFGKTMDSKDIINANDTPKFWKINKVTYPDGNYIVYKYKNTEVINGQTIPVESRIDSIKFTGNQAAGIAPYNSIKFQYGINQNENIIFENNRSYSFK